MCAFPNMCVLKRPGFDLKRYSGFRQSFEVPLHWNNVLTGTERNRQLSLRKKSVYLLKIEIVTSTTEKITARILEPSDNNSNNVAICYD